MSEFAASHKSISQLVIRLHESNSKFRVLVLIDGVIYFFNHQTKCLSRFSLSIGKNGLDDVILDDSVLSYSKSIRLAFVSCELPLGLIASIHSSRRRTDLETQTAWFDHLRTALASVRRRRLSLLTSEKTTCHPFVKRGAELMEIPLFELKLAKGESVDQWSNEILAQCPSESTISISPEIFNSQCPKPPIDYFLMVLAKCVFVIAAKKNGNTVASASKILQSPDCEKNVFVANLNDLVAEPIREELSRLGAVNWLLLGESTQVDGGGETEDAVVEPETSRIIPLKEWSDSIDFVFHCTRQRRGAWPDQSEQELVDQLLAAEAENRSACDVLMRIASMRTLIASNKLNRAKANVVCFTERSLENVKSMRVFRSHLSKWDFEPFGVGIRRSVIVELGGREVQYGTDESYAQLAVSDRPFFQVAMGSVNSNARIDWTKECEWRVIGDIDLGEIATEDMVFFVSDIQSARRLQSVWEGVIIVMHSDSMHQIRSS